tara:strand:+ start:8854 stop:9357 length:504 start_codon:yes stop_codon:yes gene_type:complete
MGEIYDILEYISTIYNSSNQYEIIQLFNKLEIYSTKKYFLNNWRQEIATLNSKQKQTAKNILWQLQTGDIAPLPTNFINGLSFPVKMIEEIDKFKRTNTQIRSNRHTFNRFNKTTSINSRPTCKYGSNCYRTSNNHMKKYRHTTKKGGSKKTKKRFNRKTKKNNLKR